MQIYLLFLCLSFMFVITKGWISPRRQDYYEWDGEGDEEDDNSHLIYSQEYNDKEDSTLRKREKEDENTLHIRVQPSWINEDSQEEFETSTSISDIDEDKETNEKMFLSAMRNLDSDTIIALTNMMERSIPTSPNYDPEIAQKTSIIIRQLSDAAVEEADENKNGLLDIDELPGFIDGFIALKATVPIKEIIRAFDINGDGGIDKQEAWEMQTDMTSDVFDRDYLNQQFGDEIVKNSNGQVIRW